MIDGVVKPLRLGVSPLQQLAPHALVAARHRQLSTYVGPTGATRSFQNKHTRGATGFKRCETTRFVLSVSHIARTRGEMLHTPLQTARSAPCLIHDVVIDAAAGQASRTATQRGGAFEPRAVDDSRLPLPTSCEHACSRWSPRVRPRAWQRTRASTPSTVSTMTCKRYCGDRHRVGACPLRGCVVSGRDKPVLRLLRPRVPRISRTVLPPLLRTVDGVGRACPCRCMAISLCLCVIAMERASHSSGFLPAG